MQFDLNSRFLFVFDLSIRYAAVSESARKRLDALIQYVEPRHAREGSPEVSRRI